LKVKPFICDFPNCGKGFTQRSNLNSHISLMHTNELKHAVGNEEEFKPKFDFKEYSQKIQDSFLSRINLQDPVTIIRKIQK